MGRAGACRRGGPCLAEEHILGEEQPPLYDQPSVIAGLRDHLNFVHLASVSGLLERWFGIEFEPEFVQPIICPGRSGPAARDDRTRARVRAGLGGAPWRIGCWAMVTTRRG